MSVSMPGIAIQIVEFREPVDRLSDLPNDLIFHILSLLPTLDAVRTCLLAKQWRRSWYSLPALNFDEKCDLRKYCTFVKYCLKLRKNDLISVEDTAIRRFRLAIKPSWKIIDYWLKMVGQSHVRELDLHFCDCEDSKEVYTLLPNALPVRSLTHLSLTRVDLKGHSSISLPKLVCLSLESVKLDDQVLQDLLSGSSLLEKVFVKQCQGLSKAAFSSSSLKLLEIDRCVAQIFYVGCTNLESLVFSRLQVETRGSQVRGALLLGRCEKLRNLSLSPVPFSEKFFEGLFSVHPRLESLTLNVCKSNRINIRHQHLKHFILEVDGSNCDGFCMVNIDAPNLVSFSFKGSPMVHLSLKARNILQANAEFCHKEYDSEWYAGLIRFLPQLDCSTNVNLNVYSEEALIFPDEVRRLSSAPFRNVKELKVAIKGPSVRRRDLMDSMFWMASGREADLNWC